MEGKEPREGYVFTQAADVEVSRRILTKMIYLADNDSLENWKEISQVEADAIAAEQERLRAQTFKTLY